MLVCVQSAQPPWLDLHRLFRPLALTLLPPTSHSFAHFGVGTSSSSPLAALSWGISHLRQYVLQVPVHFCSTHSSKGVSCRCTHWRVAQIASVMRVRVRHSCEHEPLQPTLFFSPMCSPTSPSPYSACAQCPLSPQPQIEQAFGVTSRVSLQGSLWGAGGKAHGCFGA